MKISMRAFLVHDPKTGQTSIYGSSINGDDQNREDMLDCLWDREDGDHRAIIKIEVEIPDPVPAIKAKASLAE